MTKRRESTTDHKGPMRVVRSKTTKCGWCLSQDCEHCKPELTYYDRIYVCGCSCQDGYVPEGVRNGTVQVQQESKKEKQIEPEQENEPEQPEQEEDTSDE